MSESNPPAPAPSSAEALTTASGHIAARRMEAALAALAHDASPAAEVLRAQIRPLLHVANGHVEAAAQALSGARGPVDPAVALNHLRASLAQVADHAEARRLHDLCVAALERCDQAVARARAAEQAGDDEAAEAAWALAGRLYPASVEVKRRHADLALRRRADRKRAWAWGLGSAALVALFAGGLLLLPALMHNRWEEEHRAEIAALHADMLDATDSPPQLRRKAEQIIQLVGMRRLEAADLQAMLDDANRYQQAANAAMGRLGGRLQGMWDQAEVLKTRPPAERLAELDQMLAQLDQWQQPDPALAEHLRQMKTQTQRTQQATVREAAGQKEWLERLETGWRTVVAAAPACRVELDAYQALLAGAELDFALKRPYLERVAEQRSGIRATLQDEVRSLGRRPAAEALASDAQLAALQARLKDYPLSDEEAKGVSADLAAARAALAPALKAAADAAARGNRTEALRAAIVRLQAQAAVNPAEVQTAAADLRAQVAAANLGANPTRELQAALDKVDGACRTALATRAMGEHLAAISAERMLIETDPYKARVQLAPLAEKIKGDARLGANERLTLDAQLDQLRQDIAQAVVKAQARQAEAKAFKDAIASYKQPVATAVDLRRQLGAGTPGTQAVKLIRDFEAQAARIKTHADLADLQKAVDAALKELKDYKQAVNDRQNVQQASQDLRRSLAGLKQAYDDAGGP